MKKYIQLLVKSPLGALGDKLGSDGVCPVDGRLSTASIVEIGYELMKTRKADGFEIRAGNSFTNSRLLSRWS